MFQVIALLADAQEQFLGPRTGPLLLGARYLLGQLLCGAPNNRN